MKRYFQTIVLCIIPFAVTLFIAYLLGSFVSVALNPSEWTMDARILTVEFGLAFGGALYYRLYRECLI